MSEFSPWTLNSTVPTDVTLISFDATRTDDERVLLKWQTGYEVNNLGFNVYRSEGGKRTIVNPSLVAGSALVAGPGSILTAGWSYRWWDKPPSGSENASYWLEEIDLKGQTIWHGPVAAVRSAAAKPAHPHQPQSALLSKLGTNDSQQTASSPVESRAKLPTLSVQGRSQSDPSGQPASKLSVRSESWYRVTQPELTAAGFDSKIDPRMLQLYVDGQELPCLVTGEQDGSFDPTDALEFYGVGIDSPYTGARVYWLIAGAQPGLRIQTLKGRGDAAAGGSFPYTVERQDRTIYFSGLRNGEKENFFGAVIARDPVTLSITAAHLDPSAPAAIEVALQGVTLPPHHVKVLLNDSDLGTLSFTGQEEGVLKVEAPRSLLREGQNQVTFAAQGGPVDISLVDYIRLTYGHSYTADNDALKLTPPAGSRITIDGFTNEHIRVLDVTNPDAVQELAGRVEAGKSAYSITVTAPEGSQPRLSAFTGDQALTPVVTANQPSNWGQTKIGANLIIITRGEFFSSLQVVFPLASGWGRRLNANGFEVRT